MDLFRSFDDEKEIFYFLFETLVNSKPVTITLVDKSFLMRTTHKLSFDVVMQDILYPKDELDLESFQLVLPFIDEKTLEEYQYTNLLPAAGYFSKMRPLILKRPFGLLDINLQGFESSLNSNDNRYLKDQMIFSESGYFIFNYDENIYQQVPSKELEKCRFEMKKFVLDLDQIENDLVREYLKREQRLFELLGQIKEKYLEQSKRIFGMKNLKPDPSDKASIEDFLVVWREYFRNDFGIWLISKFLFSLIDEGEFNVLKVESERLSELIDQSILKLKSINGSLTTITSLSEYHEDYLFIMEVVRELSSLLEERNQSLTQGYIVTSDKSGDRIVIENFVEIEKKNMILKEKVTREQIEQEKKRLRGSKG